MPVYDFDNSTEFQDYPLKPNPPVFTSGALPRPGQQPQSISVKTINRKWMLDLGLTFGVSSSYKYTTEVNLVRVSVAGVNVSFWFEAASVRFVFTVNRNVRRGYTVYSTGKDLVTGAISPVYGFGMLQIGDLSDLTSSGVWTGTAPVEKTLIQSLSNHYIESIHIANGPTTVINEPPCGSGDPPEAPTYSSNPVSIPIAFEGDINFKGGYFAQVTTDIDNKTITVQPVDEPGQSETLPCNPHGLLVYPLNYVAPERPACSDLIFTLNGIRPNDNNVLTLEESAGVVIEPIADHTLRITLDQNLLFKTDTLNPDCSSLFYEDSSSSSIGPPHPPPSGGADCNIKVDSTQYVGAFTQRYNLAAALGGVPRAYDITWMTGSIASCRLIITGKNGSIIHDTSCGKTYRERTVTKTIEPGQNPITVEVQPTCTGETVAHWYFRLGCHENPPTITKSDCTYTAAFGGIPPSPKNTMTFVGGTKWAGINEEFKITFTGGKWYLAITTGTEHIVWVADDLGTGGPPTTGWSLVLNTIHSAPLTLTVTETCP